MMRGTVSSQGRAISQDQKRESSKMKITNTASLLRVGEIRKSKPLLNALGLRIVK
jgi:hypothetical protein